MRSSTDWPAKGKAPGDENLLSQASSAAEHVIDLIGEAGQAIDETRKEELYRIAASTEQVVLTINGEQSSIETFDLRCFHDRLRTFSAIWKGTVTGRYFLLHISSCTRPSTTDESLYTQCLLLTRSAYSCRACREAHYFPSVVTRATHPGATCLGWPVLPS
jgi:hypothetical protein